MLCAIISIYGLHLCAINFPQKINKCNDSVSCIKLNSVRSGESRTYACLVHIISTWYYSCVRVFLHGIRAGMFWAMILERICEIFYANFSKKNSIFGFLIIF